MAIVDIKIINSFKLLIEYAQNIALKQEISSEKIDVKC